MRKTGLWRGLATLMASLLIFVIAAQITTNNWSARINSMLGTTNYEVVADDNAGSGNGNHFLSEFSSLEDMVKAQTAFTEELAAEGTVLLKNRSNALPLDQNAEPVTLWGMHTDAPILGGMMGSTAAANGAAGQTLYGLKEAMAEKGFHLNQQFIDLYASSDMDAYRMSASFFGMPVPGHSLSAVFTTVSENFDSYNVGEAPADVYNEDLSGPALKGMMVITPLYKTELPLINYTSFDQADSYMKKGLRFVRGVQGRMNDVIHHRDGSVTEWGNVSGVVNYIPEIISYRMVQETYEDLTLMMVRNPETPVEKQPEIEKILDEKLMAMFKDPSIKITYQWLDEIPVDPNGKLRVIISKVKTGAIGEPEHAGEDVGSADIAPDEESGSDE